MGEQEPGEGAADLLVHHVRAQEPVVQVRQIPVDMSLFDLVLDEILYLEPIGLIDVSQPVLALTDKIIQIRRVGIVHIVLIGEVSQHRLRYILGPFQIQGHHEMLI